MSNNKYFSENSIYFSTSTEESLHEHKVDRLNPGYSVDSLAEYSPPDKAHQGAERENERIYSTEPIHFASYPSSGVKKRKFSFSK